jgi:hypothetical protein
MSKKPTLSACYPKRESVPRLWQPWRYQHAKTRKNLPNLRVGMPPILSKLIPAILLLPGYICFSDAILEAQTNFSNSNLNSQTKNNAAPPTQTQRQESPATAEPSPSNPEKPSPGIPPELLRQIQKLPDQPQAVVVTIPRLGTAGRLLLLLLAVIVIFASIIICRFISSQNYFDGQTSVFLLLGLFGALAALIIATACVGSLYLHLAATICTIISGFCLMAFLFPQFELTRQWVTGTSKPLDTDN